MTKELFPRCFSHAPVMGILRGLPADEAVRQADTCWDAGIALVEVSLSERGALDALRQVCRRARERQQLAGAGTVVSVAALHAVSEAGAAFAVAPGVDPGVIHEARAINMPIMPGVMTASEVQEALSLGCDVLKLFPAALLGPAWVRALLGPFPALQLVAVGGVTPANAKSFLDAGAIGVALGSALASSDLKGLIGSLGN